NDRPLQGPLNVNKEGSGDMYNKGGMLHNMIRTILDDDEKLRQVLRGMNKKFYHQTVDYNDILSYMNSSTGSDLTRVFEQYVRRKSIPTLEIIQNKEGQFIYRWISEVSGFDMPVDLYGKSGEKIRLQPTTSFKPLRLEGHNKEDLQVDSFNYYIGV